MNKVPKRLQQLTSGLRIIMHNKRSKIKTIILAAPVVQAVPAIQAVLPAEEVPVEEVQAVEAPVAVAPLSMVA